VLSGLAAVQPHPLPVEQVTVAGRDLPSGTRISHADVTTVALPPAAVPDGSYSPGDAPIGRLVAAPVRRGEPLTDAGIVGPGLAAELAAGEVLTSIEVPVATAWLVRPGDVVEVVAGNPRGADAADVVATSATVVATPRDADGPDDRAVVLALDGAAALHVAQAALGSPLALLVRGP